MTRPALHVPSGKTVSILEITAAGWVTVQWPSGLVSDLYAPFTRGILAPLAIPR